jgi:hypothetical protein
MAQGIDPSQERADAGDDPFQRRILREQLDRVAEEKRRALEDPGPSWKEWLLQSAAKWWIGLGVLVLDAMLVVEFLDLGGHWLVYLVPALAGAVYAEFLLWRVLWYIPAEMRRRFVRTWYRPVPYGRWTPEAEYARAHPMGSVDGPSADDFL